jgi:hypothetical protein
MVENHAICGMRAEVAMAAAKRITPRSAQITIG